MRSDSPPEKTLVMLAVASAMPSITPTVSADVPRTDTRKTGSRAWIISEEMSINMLTKPRTQTVLGMRRRVAVSIPGGSTFKSPSPWLYDERQLHGSEAQALSDARFYPR